VSAEQPGRLALVGSGEYLEAMASLEASLLGGGTRYVQIPLAAGLESDERYEYWIELGRTQAARLGATAVTIRARTRADALDPALAAQVVGADLIYLSGGDPRHLAESLRATPLWEAIVEAWRRGASLAGCSAGAMILGSVMGRLRAPHAEPWRGLGVLPGVAILPHFDRVRTWLGDRVRPVPGAALTVGIDELTALVGSSRSMEPWGQGGCWIVRSTGLERLVGPLQLSWRLEGEAEPPELEGPPAG